MGDRLPVGGCIILDSMDRKSLIDKVPFSKQLNEQRELKNWGNNK